MRALHTAATGMMAQELNVQVISNNIANMRTTGYKRQRAEFQDLLYEHVSRVGTQTSSQGNILPAGIELGSGVKAVGTPRLMTQGELVRPVRTTTLPSAAPASSRFCCRTGAPPIRATAPSNWMRRASGDRARKRGAARHHHPAGRKLGLDQLAGPSLGDAARLDHTNIVGQLQLTLRQQGRPEGIGDNCISKRPPPARRRTARPPRRLRQYPAGQPRTGQCRGGERDFRPDRRPARLRDERQGHHRRRPDAVGHLQPDALRSHDPQPHRRAPARRPAAWPGRTSLADPPASRRGRRHRRSGPRRRPGRARRHHRQVPIFRAPDLGLPAVPAPRWSKPCVSARRARPAGIRTWR